MDAYRANNKVVLWVKSKDKDIRLERDFTSFIYIHPQAQRVLKKHEIPYERVTRKTYLRRPKEVLKIKIPKIDGFEKFIRDIEIATKHRIPLYNADVKPEQMFLYKHDLRPCSEIKMQGKNIVPIEGSPSPLLTTSIKIKSDNIYKDQNAKLKGIIINNKTIKGTEKEIVERFVEEFKDPDVIRVENAFSRIPYLINKLKVYNLKCDFHRWDPIELKYKGGRPFWTYGIVYYREFPIRLHGRFLLDVNSTMGSYSPNAIAELAQLSGNCFQQTASRSFGAVFQFSLIRLMIQEGFLIPFKEKPIDKPLSLFEYLKADRAGHTFDPKVGFNKNVAEIDFTSMFPWLIYNRNISADTILTDQGPFDKVPSVPIKISLRYKGLVPRAIKPLLDRRMYYKKNQSRVNKERAAGLKAVLVSSYGYLRFREFKMGIPSSHMAICAYARETIIEASQLAQSRGFEVVHGISDCLYITKKGINEEEVRDLKREIELMSGIPMSFEGIFKWVIFLPSINEKERPLPATYFGAFKQGGIKARGIEVRQRSAPAIVQIFQEQCLELMATADTKDEIISMVPELFFLLRKAIKRIDSAHPNLLRCVLKISKTDYKNDIPQKRVVDSLIKQGYTLMPGKKIEFIHQVGGAVPKKDYNGLPNKGHYKKLLIRSLVILLQVFGYTKEMVESAANGQQLLYDPKAVSTKAIAI